MSQSSDEAPTGPINGRPQRPARHRNVAVDLTAATLLVVALVLPWNLYSGLTIAGSNGVVLAVLFAVTLLSLISLAAPAKRIRLWLNVPYLLVVAACVVFDAFETVRFGGSVTVPGGVGPGAWLGIAGSLLSAQPAVAGDDRFAGWLRAARNIGYASIVLAVASFGFNLYWRLKYALTGAGGSAGFGKQNIAVIATAVVYGVVALVAVVVASRWLLRNTKAARLATVALGASTLVAGIVVWGLPVGRDIDAFHGIAQNTSTAGVGFEGFLAWAAAAAIFARLPGDRGASTEPNAWRAAARNGLLLIVVWCLGSMAMRITDLAVGVMLNYPYSRYDSIVLAAFDLGTAVIAIWLRVNLANDAVSARLISSLCGLVATLSISRVIVGVVLAPRFAEVPAAAHNPVYGNNLAQQITSTFDVALCGLALCILAAAIVTGQLTGRRVRRRRPPAARKPVRPPSAAPTTRVRVGESPRIFRGDDSGTRRMPTPKPKIYRPPGR